MAVQEATMLKRYSDIYCIRVESEPGDATHYSYVVVQNDHIFSFLPFNNSFRYPQLLDYWSVKDITSVDDPNLLKIAKEQYCNPFTVLECVRTIIAIMAGAL